ncbi:hypothetical protein SETIT_7G157800v2, partial [Setaria italica]
FRKWEEIVQIASTITFTCEDDVVIWEYTLSELQVEGSLAALVEYVRNAQELVPAVPCKTSGEIQCVAEQLGGTGGDAGEDLLEGWCFLMINTKL